MDVLLFPRTEPDTPLIQSLLTVFDGVACLRPLEDDGTATASPAPATPCKRIVPAPLGGDRPRFLRMLLDMRSHPDEYYEGFLRSLSDTVSGHRPALVEEIISGFAPQRAGAAKEEGERTKALWQARLVLALAEMVEAEEAAVAAGLAAVEARERELLASLHGETDLPDDEDMDFHQNLRPAPLLMTSLVPPDQRCLAWAQLFLLLTEAPWPAFAVTSPEALSWLGNQYEKKTRTAPVEIGRLHLPEKALDDAAAALAGLCQLLEDTAAGRQTAETAAAAFAPLAGQWEEDLANHGLRTGEGGTLRFLLFPGLSLGDLLAAALRLPSLTPKSPAFPQGLAVFWESP